MKVTKYIENSEGKDTATIEIIPEDREDLFTLYQIISKDDELIFRKKFKVKDESDGKSKANRKQTSSNELVKFRAKVVSTEFDMKEEFLRYKCVTVPDDTGGANVDVSAGKFVSFTVDYTHSFTIIKLNFDEYAKGLLEEACNPELKADTAAVVLQEGVAHVCILTASSTILKQKIEYSLPKKKSSTDILKFDEKMEKFYRAIYESVKQNFDFSRLKMIILCSPGFYAKTLMEKLILYSEEEQYEDLLNNKSIFFVAHCSTGYLQGITEVLKNPDYATKLQDTKYSKEATIMDNFLKHLNDDDYKAWYGDAEVKKAASLGAIDHLLITDYYLRSRGVEHRKWCIELMDSVKQTGGQVTVFSTLHISGEELEKLTGIACILKYPLPDLDEGLESEEDD